MDPNWRQVSFDFGARLCYMNLKVFRVQIKQDSIKLGLVASEFGLKFIQERKGIFSMACWNSFLCIAPYGISDEMTIGKTHLALPNKKQIWDENFRFPNKKIQKIKIAKKNAFEDPNKSDLTWVWNLKISVFITIAHRMTHPKIKLSSI